MLTAELLDEAGILMVHPESPLAESDFQAVGNLVDPFIHANGKLRGILIQAEQFPGWKDFSSFVSHMRFVHDHHKQVGKIAIVSDSKTLEIAPSILGHFVQAKLKHFGSQDTVAALAWLEDDDVA